MSDVRDAKARPARSVGTSETGDRIEAIDWARTSLGALQSWSQSLRTTVDLMLASPIGMVLMWGPDHVMIYNDGYIPIAGARHPAALGGTVPEIWPEIWDWNRAILDRGFAGESAVYRDQKLVVQRNGNPEEVWLDLFYTPVRDDDRAIAAVLCTVVETTAHVVALAKQAESERRLAQSEARLSMLVDQANIGITQSDLSDRMTAANERFCEMVGRPRADLVGQSPDAFMHPDDREASRAERTVAMRQGQALVAERRFVKPDGTIVWVSSHVSPARDAAGRPEFIISVTQDISDRKLAEMSARESTERIELALNTGAILGMFVCDDATELVRGDIRFAKTFSLDIGRTAAGVPYDDCLAAVHPEDREVARETFRLLDGQPPGSLEYRVRQEGGGWLWVEANRQLDERTATRRPKFLGMLINIDQRRAAAERQSFLIALGDRLSALEEPRVIVQKAVEATFTHLHATRVGYGDISPDAKAMDLLAGASIGTEPLRGRFPTTVFGSQSAELLKTGEVAMISAGSVETDLRAAPDAQLLAVPLFRENRWHAVMFAEASRAWTLSEADLLREVIGRTWEAVERAKAVLTLRRAQGRQAFLLRLNDHLSEIDEPAEVLRTVAESLGTYLKATRTSYGEVDLTDRSITFLQGWSDGSIAPLDGRFSYEGLAEAEIDEMRRGLTISENDLGGQNGREPERHDLLDRLGTHALLAVPLIRDGRFRAGLFLFQQSARQWTLDEISLAQEVARRTWDALERTRAEQALQLSEARLRTVFETLPVGIVFAEMPSGRVTEGNARVEQILGYAVFPSLDTAAFDEWIAFDEQGRRVPVEDHPLYVAVTTGETTSRVFRHQRGDGSQIWIDVVGAAVRGAGGAITGGLLTIVDVDREKKAEAALRDLNTTLEHQIEARTRERDRVWRNSQDLLAVIDSDTGVLQAMNPSWVHLLGWSVEELVGHPFDARMHPDDVASTARALLSLKDGPLAAPFENRFHRKVGTDRWFSWTASLEGGVVYANGRDVTAEKEQAEALRHAEEQLRQSQKMEAVGQLTGGIAHDFNNLLTGITGALDLLSKRIGQGRLENTDRYIGMAMNSANRAAALTHRLLAFSRRQPLEAKPVDVNHLVISMDDLLRRTIGEKVTLEVALCDGLWLTLCDLHQLENALLNLVINARDAMPDGGELSIETGNVTLENGRIELEGGTKPGRYVILSVSDTGTGMSPDVIARAFDPFFTTKPIGQGTGLGLSMIYGFAKQSEGTVRIVSEVGIGTTVHLYLPRFRGTVVEPLESKREAPRAGAGEVILVVEDDATVRKLVLEILRDLDYVTLEAHDGPSGLEVLRSADHIDLLVTDVGLPGINGRQLADQARESRPDLKVLFITGYAENSTFGSEHLDPGMQMITKPFVVEVFATRIKDMLAAG